MLPSLTAYLIDHITHGSSRLLHPHFLTAFSHSPESLPLPPPLAVPVKHPRDRRKRKSDESQKRESPTLIESENESCRKERSEAAEQ